MVLCGRHVATYGAHGINAITMSVRFAFASFQLAVHAIYPDLFRDACARLLPGLKKQVDDDDDLYYDSCDEWDELP